MQKWSSSINVLRLKHARLQLSRYMLSVHFQDRRDVVVLHSADVCEIENLDGPDKLYIGEIGGYSLTYWHSSQLLIDIDKIAHHKPAEKCHACCPNFPAVYNISKARGMSSLSGSKVTCVQSVATASSAVVV
jgi:hypothetical protein